MRPRRPARGRRRGRRGRRRARGRSRRPARAGRSGGRGGGRGTGRRAPPGRRARSPARRARPAARPTGRSRPRCSSLVPLRWFRAPNRARSGARNLGGAGADTTTAPVPPLAGWARAPSGSLLVGAGGGGALAEALLEPGDAAAGVEDLLLAGVEGVARRADLDGQRTGLRGAAGREGVGAVAGHGRDAVGVVDVG